MLRHGRIRVLQLSCFSSTIHSKMRRAPLELIDLDGGDDDDGDDDGIIQGIILVIRYCMKQYGQHNHPMHLQLMAMWSLYSVYRNT